MSLDTAPNPVESIILPPVCDLGDGFSVRRALPSANRWMVGPFIVFDQMGPAAFEGGQALDLRAQQGPAHRPGQQGRLARGPLRPCPAKERVHPAAPRRARREADVRSER